MKRILSGLFCNVILIVGLSSAKADDYISRCGGTYIELHRRAEPQEALEACNRVIASPPSDLALQYAHANRGFMYFLLKNYAASVADNNTYLSNAAAQIRAGTALSLANAYKIRSADNYFLGNYEQALADLDESNRILKQWYPTTFDPAATYPQRGDIELRLKNYSDAIEHYELFKEWAGTDIHRKAPQLEENLKLARRLAANPDRSPSQNPASPPTGDACQLYPNLC